MGNPNHEPKGSPKGGQFTGYGNGIAIRTEPMKGDVSAYSVNGEAQALYDGGYLIRTDQSHENAEELLKRINREHETKEPWLGHRELIDNYLRVAKGYVAREKCDIVRNGKYSSGGVRKNQEVMDEFRLSQSDIFNIINNLTADDFVSSGANDSKDKNNKGTVVMVFSPRVKLTKLVENSNGKLKKKKVTIDLYVKLVINPHPNKERGHSELQILSLREANNKKCLFTGEERKSRNVL